MGNHRFETSSVTRSQSSRIHNDLSRSDLSDHFYDAIYHAAARFVWQMP